MPSPERHIQVHGRYLHPLFKFSLPSNLTTLEFHSLLPISLSPQRPAFTFPALLNWLTRLCANLDRQNDPAHPFHKHPYKLRSLDIQVVDWFWRDVPGKEDKLGFMKLQAEITTDKYLHEGGEEKSDWLPGAVFLRGGSVAILVSPNTHYDGRRELIYIRSSSNPPTQQMTTKNTSF
jgi:ADP-sugar diphosphatase